MPELEHIVIAYGPHIAYQNGAKYQILKNWSKWYSRAISSVCVVTDRPDLFWGYPIRVLELTDKMKTDWSLNGLQHFGIKLKGLRYAIATSKCERCIQLDTDSYWISDPLNVARKIICKQIVMHSNEGKILGSRNTSIQRFEEGLSNKTIDLNGKAKYQLSSESRMLNSRILGMCQSDIEVLDLAFDLFTQIEPLVNAHTVEQYSISEASRIRDLNVIFDRRTISDWSSTGRKNHATPIINNFFAQTANLGFEELVEKVKDLNIKRTLGTLISQKLLAKNAPPQVGEK